MDSIFKIESDHPVLGGTRFYLNKDASYKDTLIRVETMLKAENSVVASDEIALKAKEFLDAALIRYERAAGNFSDSVNTGVETTGQREGD